MHGGGGTGRPSVPHLGVGPRPFAPVVAGPPGLPLAPSFGSAPPWIPFVGNLSTTLRPNGFGLNTATVYGGIVQPGGLPGLNARSGDGRGRNRGAVVFPSVIIPGFVDPALAGFDVGAEAYAPLAQDPAFAAQNGAEAPGSGAPASSYPPPPYGASPYPAPGYPAQGYAPQGGYGQPYPGQPVTGFAAPPYGGGYGQPGPSPEQGTALPAAPPREHDPLTLYFVDGRPPEQVRNYALTRSALLITGDRMREIPLSEIDLPTTQQVNKAAGIDFRLPN